MSPSDKSALEALAALLLEKAGLKITPDGFHSLRLALSARMPALGMSDAKDYVRRLRGLAGEHELRALLPYVTVGKTDFFRDRRQMTALEVAILPALREDAQTEMRKLMIWSAGCATGEEPYTLAMMLAEANVLPENVELVATDVNPAAIESAKAGRYPARRLNGVSPDRLTKFFHREDGGYVVQEELKRYVQFEGHNLAAPVFPRIRPSSLDLILCRNVIIYFDLRTIRAVMDRFLEALRPGGYLLLGYSESLFQVYDHFQMVEVEGSFCYRRPGRGSFASGLRKDTVSTRTSSLHGRVPALTYPHPEGRVSPEPPVSTSVDRSPKAVPPPPLPLPPLVVPPAPPGRAPSERLSQIGRVLQSGDFELAFKQTLALLQDHPNDLAALLTWGNIASLLGKFDQAQEAFSQALSREPLCPDARVFWGMAAMQERRYGEAKAELNKALFLEPSLALGHYMLAQVLERIGDLKSARKSYRNAIDQLRRPQRPLAGYYPDMAESLESISRAARYALAHLEETDDDGT